MLIGGEKQELKKSHHFLIDSTAERREMPQHQNSHQVKLSFDFYNYRIEKKSSVHVTNTVSYKNKPTEKTKDLWSAGAWVPPSSGGREALRMGLNDGNVSFCVPRGLRKVLRGWVSAHPTPSHGRSVRASLNLERKMKPGDAAVRRAGDGVCLGGCLKNH